MQNRATTNSERSGGASFTLPAGRRAGCWAAHYIPMPRGLGPDARTPASRFAACRHVLPSVRFFARRDDSPRGLSLCPPLSPLPGPRCEGLTPLRTSLPRSSAPSPPLRVSASKSLPHPPLPLSIALPPGCGLPPCGAGRQLARRLPAAAVSCGPASWPIANRPQLAKPPHNRASSLRISTLSFKPACREIASAPLLCRAPTACPTV